MAPVCAAVALLFNLHDLSFLATYTQVSMAAMGGHVTTYFPPFLLVAVFGKLMDASGSAHAIALRIAGWTGPARVILAVVLSCPARC